MVYFKINGLGYNCGYNENKCPNEKESCIECIKARLKELGFEFDSTIEIIKVDSIEKQLKLERETIWRKFLDVLNIKHIIVMDKGSGLTLLNYAVSGVDIDANLLTGFIQANITFSESGEVSDQYLIPSFEYNYYEFQYKSFNILLKDGDYVRVCLILDHKASNKLKSHTFRFVEGFEHSFENELIIFQDTGGIETNNMINAIVESFNISLMFPMTLEHSIPPYELEKVKRSVIQKAIYNLANEMLAVKPFFFIYNMLKRLKKIVNIEDEVVIYEIHQLLERRVFKPTSIEAMANNIESVQEADQKKEMKTSSISSIIMSDTDIDELKDRLEFMDEYTAHKLIKEIMRKAKAAERDSTYQIPINEYNKALYIAQDFKFKDEVNKLSRKIFDLEHKFKNIELDFNIEKAENAEKYGDFINSINYFQKALEILDGFKVYNIIDPRIKKFKKKILKLRDEI
ncbi:MAG: hypothetical protein HWN79_00890 [Candidatus Lokiarchaeota archaeon]|nr:hypothetical protein [Candidatus Lokiarchaeota archaeon]